ncbi:MAG: DUF2793 domain-containing protein [Sphingomonas oligoaromativorans]|jgi:hypothetical protein|uniref:DUF2793 domain-containing protein n=1 Tax=Sphingomonas oligoaromativorans TaxID=575322 RepID=UPI0014249D01|nr:DUF2793 domain-containing protein [Sphingomonas oligoaromativorans]NIJ31866.1 hypothetical protein [Sphingomonas oligoaromativorans]
MSDATARLALPFIAPGQAQKELFHNEALTRIDALLQAAVEAVAVDDPPSAPVPGQCWITGAAPTGAWAGQPDALASWTEGGWRFVAGRAGMILWSNADKLFVWFDGALWRMGDVVAQRVIVGGRQVVSVQQSAIADPAGGTVSDAESRAAIVAILAALRNHGLVAI